MPTDTFGVLLFIFHKSDVPRKKAMLYVTVNMHFSIGVNEWNLNVIKVHHLAMGRLAYEHIASASHFTN